MNKQKRINKLERAYKLTNICTRDNTSRVRPRIASLPYRTLALPFTIYRQVIPVRWLFFSFLFFFLSSTRATPGYNIPSLPPLYIYSMNNSCNTPRSIPLLDIAERTGKRCRGILYKYLLEREKARERQLFNGAFIVRRRRRRRRFEQIEKTEAKRIVSRTKSIGKRALRSHTTHTVVGRREFVSEFRTRKQWRAGGEGTKKSGKKDGNE